LQLNRRNGCIRCSDVLIIIPAHGHHQRNHSPFSLPFTATSSRPSLCSFPPLPPLGLPSSTTTIPLHCRSSGGSGPPSSPHHVAPGCSPICRPVTSGAAVHRTAIFFRTGRRRPLRSVLLWAVREYCKLHRQPLLLSEPKFYSGNHPPVLPSTTSSLIIFLTVARPPR
jgi:hypothetical protein